MNVFYMTYSPFSDMLGELRRENSAVLIQRERDIADEDLWGIITKKENARQQAEMQRFGNKQVNRYLEKAKLATETEFTSSLGEGESAQQNEGQAAE